MAVYTELKSQSWEMLRFIGMFSPAGALFAFLWKIWEEADTISQQIDALTLKVQALATAIQSSNGPAYLAQANRVFPWSEVLWMFGILFAAKVAAALVRIVKSWIPTVS